MRNKVRETAKFLCYKPVAPVQYKLPSFQSHIQCSSRERGGAQRVPAQNGPLVTISSTSTTSLSLD